MGEKGPTSHAHGPGGMPRARVACVMLSSCDDYQPVFQAPASVAGAVLEQSPPLLKKVPAFAPDATSAMLNFVPPFDVSDKQTTPLSPATTSPTATVSFAPQPSEDSTPFMVAVVASYAWLSVYTVFSAVRPLRRSDCAARSWARCRAPRKVGMAIAIRMAMMSTTTMSSMR